ncbi:ATP-binding protein [Marinobacterium sp. MBR-109]|jgi:PAS domain S-box-containing protein|uniref:ATP-binding protein n=1 Tax=Marinobacterium sp. MBR-109 TaxID=3156462 RepID=UPI0033985038
MYVGTPFSVRTGTAWTLSLSHAVLDSSGEFEGAVFAALDESFFSAMLSSMNYAPDMWTGIAHGRGRQFMITPAHEGLAGIDLAKPGSFFTRHMESGNDANIMTGQVLATGDKRIMALQTINPPALKLDWPLVLGTGRRLDAVFALWSRDLRLVLLFYALTVLASVALLYLYQRRIRAQVALNNALSSSLVTERRRLAGILEATNVGTWEWHVKTGQVVFNDRWAGIAGYSLDELQPVSIETWHSLAHPDDLAKSDKMLQQHFSGELDYYDCEARIRHKSGEWVWVLGRGCVMQRDADGSPVIMMGTHIDITDKKNAELRLQASLESLARYNQELEQFASVVSHDLRQPIRTVSGYLELLRAHLGDRLTEDAEKMVVAAERGTQRLDQMLCGLLEYARTGLDDGPKAPIHLLDVITDVRELLNSEFEHSHARIICPPEMGSVTIKACRDDLLRLFMNLISNAIKYRRPDTDPVIELAVSPVDGGWCFTVIDNGVGFDPAQAGRLFNMFQRLHSRADYPGSGIGLALCKKIVERYRGEIHITSSGPGTGARVSFTLYE